MAFNISLHRLTFSIFLFSSAQLVFSSDEHNSDFHHIHQHVEGWVQLV